MEPQFILPALIAFILSVIISRRIAKSASSQNKFATTFIFANIYGGLLIATALAFVFLNGAGGMGLLLIFGLIPSIAISLAIGSLVAFISLFIFPVHSQST